jgi:hypothetical protein
VTFVFGIRSRDAVWLVADRRFSFGKGKPPKDDSAVKMMSLQTNDGIGLIGYAGIGATHRGTQISDWMVSVLQGRGGLTFDDSLAALVDAANRELPVWLVRAKATAHWTVIPAFVNGEGRLYVLGTSIDPATRRPCYVFTRPVRGDVPGKILNQRSLHAGYDYGVIKDKDNSWWRTLYEMLDAQDRWKITPLVVADYLAALNYEVHQRRPDGFVGPNCVVAFRYRHGVHRWSGQQSYTGLERDSTQPIIPMISGAIDWNRVGPAMETVFESNRRGDGLTEEYMLAWNEMHTALGLRPDERLN